MAPTPRAAWLLGACALSALLVPRWMAAGAALLLGGAAAADALAAQRPVELVRRAPGALARGVPAELTVSLSPPLSRIRVRQPQPPDVEIDPSEADGRLDARVVARRRGRHVLSAPALRIEGPLGLVSVYRRAGADAELRVYPDLPRAWRLAHALRRGRLTREGRRLRGPLGLGTDFESVRDYQVDDDIRMVNWLATARLGRPMTNQYRVEQDRDVVCVIDAGRLMGAPLRGATRLDVAVDAAAAMCLVADEVGDRCGAVAFDSRVLRQVSPRRKGARATVEALFDLEPSPHDADYELAFRTASVSKRAFVVVLTDLLEEAAARGLIEAVPLLARRHAVIVASSTDPDLVEITSSPPTSVEDVYAAAAGIEVLQARRRVAAHLRAAGAEVVEAPPELLGDACVRSYLRAKARARL